MPQDASNPNPNPNPSPSPTPTPNPDPNPDPNPNPNPNPKPDPDPNQACLKMHGIKMIHEIDQITRKSIACPAFPLCGLAITEVRVRVRVRVRVPRLPSRRPFAMTEA